MSENIRINTDRLRSDAAEIKNHIQEVKRELENLKGMNESEVRDVFPIEILEEAIQSLEAMNAYEINAVEKYDDCERKVGDLVNQIKV
jgi:chromosome segregation ATPase